MPDAVAIRCRVNGSEETVRGHPMMRLLDALRTGLHLTGTKEGCGEGECGACAISLDGRLVNSCLVPLLQADGAVIVTIEGVAGGERLHALQEAFIASGGAQCGICTPGMILAALMLLERTTAPSEAEVRQALAGNLCRCTGYVRIFEAVLNAAELQRARAGAFSRRGAPERDAADAGGGAPASREKVGPREH